MDHIQKYESLNPMIIQSKAKVFCRSEVNKSFWNANTFSELRLVYTLQLPNIDLMELKAAKITKEESKESELDEPQKSGTSYHMIS